MRLQVAFVACVTHCVFFTLPTPTSAAGVVVASAVNPANGHTYYEIAGDSNGAGISWTDAESTAVSLGGHLVTINDASENDWVASAFNSSYYEWIGLNDAANEGVFIWTSGEPVTYTNWWPGEPNSWSGDEDYGEMYNWDGNNMWNDNTDNAGGNPYGIAEIVPEPSTLVLLSIGAVSLLAYSRRRRAT
jgi:hypothetical protein